MATATKSPQSSAPQAVVTRPIAPSHTPASNGFSPPTTQQAAGNLAVQRLFRSGAIQAKLAISQPGDPDEQEADRIAEQVMRMPEPGGAVPCGACAAGDQPCPKCSGTPKIHRKVGDSSGGMAASDNPLRHLGSGQSLDRDTRAFFEPRFGRDLSGVRVHTDRQAAESAHAIQARAFSLGHEMVFGRGEYMPESRSGKQLIAHELTHVVQQGFGSAAIQRSAREVGGNLNFLSIQRQVAIAPDATEDAARPPVPKPPSDINLGFNALDASHRLIEVINQSEIKLSKPGDSGYYKGQVAARHIDFAAVHAVLSGLTANQVKQVEERYLEYEGRSLYVDLFRGGESGHLPDLTVEQQYRLKALLGGTRASSEEDAEAAAQNQREADAAELRGLLTGRLGAAEVERVMTLLRRPADEAIALMNEYNLNHDLRSDLFRMGISNAIRAMMLLSGSSIAADAYAIGMARNRIIVIDEELKALRLPTEVTAMNLLMSANEALNPTVSIQRKQRIKVLEAERKAQAQLIEERVQVAAGEAKKEAEGEAKDALDTDTAIRTRVSSVLGAEGATEAVVGGASGKLIGAVAINEPAEQVAAQLRKLEESGKLTTEAITDAFRGLRMQAVEEAQRRYPDATVNELKEEERKLSDQWFIHLRSTWDAAVVGEGRTFSQILDRGDQTEVDVKRGLYMASGRLGDADELVLALAGDRKDMETVKRVLRDKNADQIADLKRQYQLKTKQLPYWPIGRSLDFDLFGTAPTKVGEKQEIDYSTMKPKGPQGKASGTDRLVLEDYLQRPSREGDMEEVDYVAGRAEREYEYTIDNRGATGWWRDHWGNEALSLLDATIKEVHQLRTEYMTATRNGADKEAVKSAEAHEIIHKMHLARATIRGDRAGYEKATAELRATFQAVASFVLQAVLTAVLTPFATAIFAARLAKAGAMFATWTKNTVVGMASTIAANKTVYGNDYNTDMLLHDLKGGLGSAIGATGVGRLLGPVTQRLTDRLGKTMAGEVIAGAKTVGGMEATAVLEGEPANIFENFLEQHFLGKVSDVITHGTTKALRLDPTTVQRGGKAGTGEEVEAGPTRPADAGPADVDIADASAIRTPMALEPQPAKPREAEKSRAEPLPEPDAAKPTAGLDEPAVKVAETTLPVAEPAAVANPSVSEPAATAANTSAPKPREVNKYVVRRPTAVSKTQHSQQPAGVPKPLVDETVPQTKKAVPEAGAPIGPKVPGGDAAQEHTQVTGAPTGMVVQADDPYHIIEAWKLYQQQITADPTREVALLYNHDLDQWAVVQGGPGSVPTLAGMRRLGWEVRDTALARHSHPVGPGGVTSEPNLLPSGRRGDLPIARGDAPKGEPSAAAHITAIDVMTARGPDRTFLSYDRKADMWIVDYPAVGGRGGRERVSFVSMDQYQKWFQSRFGFSPDIPVSAVGSAGPHVSGADGSRGSGTNAQERSVARERLDDHLIWMYEKGIDPSDLGYNEREWDQFQRNYNDDPERALHDFDRKLDILRDVMAETKAERTSSKAIEQFAEERPAVSVSSEASVARAADAGVPIELYGDGTVMTRADFPDSVSSQPPVSVHPAPPQRQPVTQFDPTGSGFPTAGRPVSRSDLQNVDVLHDYDVLIRAGADPASIRINQKQVVGNVVVDANRPDLHAVLPNGQRIHIEYDRAPGTRAMAHARRILTNDPEAIVILKIIDF